MRPNLLSSFPPARLRTCAVLAAVACATLAGCAIRDVRDQQLKDVDDTRQQIAAAPQSRAVVMTHASSWLLGEEIPASKPQPAIFDRTISYHYQAGSLADLARRITAQTGIPTAVDDSARDAATSSLGSAAAFAANASPLPPGQPGVTSLAAPLPPGDLSGGLPGAWPSTSAPSFLQYNGSFKGFLDLVDSHYAVWSAYRDGVITFYRTETRVLPLPNLADSGHIESKISTSSGDASGSGSSGSSSGSSAGSTSTSTQSASMKADVEPARKLQASAQAIAGGGKVDANPDLGVLTVTGTPPQCDRVEAWVKSLNATYAKRIAIDVRIYAVRMSREDNYGLDLAFAYKSASGHTSVGISGASVPKIQGTANPFSFGANILTGPFAGTKGAIQALSSLGDVSQVLSSAGVTQNGKWLTLQDAANQGYVPQTQSTLASNVGSSTSMQSSTLTTGFTSSFLPKLINGNINIDFNVTLSQLIGMDTFPPGCTAGQSCVQTPKTQATQLQDIVTLKPGDTLVLTGHQQHVLTTAANGVGTPWLPILGGGADAQKSNTLIAIVLSARLL